MMTKLEMLWQVQEALEKMSKEQIKKVLDYVKEEEAKEKEGEKGEEAGDQ